MREAVLLKDIYGWDADAGELPAIPAGTKVIVLEDGLTARTKDPTIFPHHFDLFAGEYQETHET